MWLSGKGAEETREDVGIGEKEKKREKPRKRLDLFLSEGAGQPTTVNPKPGQPGSLCQWQG